MSITNLVPVILIFLFLVIIFLIDYYKNICFNNVKNNKKINLDKVNPTLALYCYKTGTIKNLFNITILNLINNGFFELVRVNDTTYISSTSKKDKIYQFEETIRNYIDEILNNKKLKIDEFNEKLTLDYKYLAKTNKFFGELKNDANKEFGKLDFISENIYSFIVGVLYFMQIAFFVYNDFSLSQVFWISIPCSLINILICDKIKNNIIKVEKKQIIFLISLSVISSIISCFIWIHFNSSNYILFHVIIGLLSFMYPLFACLNIYFMKTNKLCLNKKQKEIKDSLRNLQNELLVNEKMQNEYCIYTKMFKIKCKFKDDKIKDYFEYMF